MSKPNGVVVRGARDHVFTLFRGAENLPLEYHHFARAREIVDACKEIVKGSKLDDEARDVALVCAWFYDACYATGSDDHGKSLELCLRFLDEQHARHPTHDQIAACFRGGVGVEGVAPDGVPEDLDAPSDVLHDARLAVLARKDYVERAELLRSELQRRSGKTITDVEWTQGCIAFFGAHAYRTRFAQLFYGPDRAANLARLQKLLRRQQKEVEEEKRADESSVARRLGRSAETLFYHFTRIQLGLVGMADRRTSTMIHVNAIMMSIVVALLSRRIQTERDFLLPTALLLSVNLAVVFLSLYSMRAGRRSLPAEEARVHDANLLAFTNETPASLSEYTEHMSGLVADPAQFQRRVLEHLYFIRKMLSRRAKALRLTYDVFIYGLTLAIVAFIVTLARR
jgi:hypothetical protein